MDQIEISINLSMSGASFQPSSSTTTTTTTNQLCQQQQQQQQQLQTGPKIIPNSGNYFNSSISSASTTPTDLMECSTLNVY
jgi:hypothetical protein